MLLANPLGETMPDIDALAEINQRLSRLAPIKYQEFVPGPYIIIPAGIPYGYGQAVPGPLIATVVEGAAVATSTTAETFSDVSFRETEVTALPTQVLVQRERYIWCSDGEYRRTKTLQVNGTRGYTIKKLTGLKTTTTKNFTLSASYNPGREAGIGGSVSTSLTAAAEVSSSTEVSETHSETVAVSDVFDIHLTKRETGTIELIAYQHNVRLPFSCKVLVDGSIKPNLSNVSKISQLLPESDRTFIIDGYIEISGVSDRLSKIQADDDSPRCGRVPTANTALFRTANLNLDRSVFDSISGDPNLSTGLHRALFEGDGTSMGPADGEYYEVISSREFLKPSVQCGFNDLALPNPGKYRAETRKYTTYSQGTLISTRTDDVEVFIECQSV